MLRACKGAQAHACAKTAGEGAGAHSSADDGRDADGADGAGQQGIVLASGRHSDRAVGDLHNTCPMSALTRQLRRAQGQALHIL